mgnify:CR=1 FL=1
MSYSTVTSKGQVTIPKSIRDRLGIGEGSKLVFIDDGDRMLVYRMESSLESLFGAVAHEGPPLDFEALRERMGEEMARDAGARAEAEELTGSATGRSGAAHRKYAMDEASARKKKIAARSMPQGKTTAAPKAAITFKGCSSPSVVAKAAKKAKAKKNR